MRRAYEHRHTVSFAETNLVGNVYYVNHLAWQGRVREMFLKEHAPDILRALTADLALATVRCSCEYYAELRAFDELVIRMRLSNQSQNRITMQFEYFRVDDFREELVAQGEQTVACLQRDGDQLVPCPVPPSLLAALEPYRE